MSSVNRIVEHQHTGCACISSTVGKSRFVWLCIFALFGTSFELRMRKGKITPGDKPLHSNVKQPFNELTALHRNVRKPGWGIAFWSGLHWLLLCTVGSLFEELRSCQLRPRKFGFQIFASVLTDSNCAAICRGWKLFLTIICLKIHVLKIGIKYLKIIKEWMFK